MKLWTFVSKRGWYICMSSSPSFFIISESEGLEITLLMILTCLQAVHWLWLLSTSSCNISGQNVSISWWLLWSRHYLQVLQPHQPWWSPQNSLWFNDAFHVLGELKQMQHSDGVSGVLSRVIQSLCLLCWPHCSYWCDHLSFQALAIQGLFCIWLPSPSVPSLQHGQGVSVLSLVTSLELLLELLF